MAIASNARRTRILVLFTSALLLTFEGAQGTEGSLSVAQAVTAAIESNPGLAQVRERHAALLEIPSQVGTLPDPIINLNAMNFPVADFHRRQEPMTQVQVGIMQAFPFPGKLSLRKEAAEFEAHAMGHSVDDLRVQLVADVRKTWWQVYYLDRAFETVKSNQQLFREFIQIARKKYETGIGLQQDVLLAQLELSGLLDQELQIDAARRLQAITLNVLMDQPKLEEVTLSVVDRKELTILKDKEVYFEFAEARPLLKKKHAQADAARVRLSSAERDLYPDFNIGVNYGERRGDNSNGSSRDDFFSVMVGVKIPLYANRKQDKALRQRASESQSAIYAAVDTRGQIYGAITMTMTMYQRAFNQFDLFKTTIIPQATQTVRSMLAGYQVNEVDFLNLVRAQITLLNYELQYWRSFSDAKQSLAALEGAVGEANIYE
jgi:cobalt-zinc-cadmium efflux system outer membrane protein